MQFHLQSAIQVLRQTPHTLEVLFQGLPQGWVSQNEGGESWSPFDIVGHLVHGERADWISRAKIILEEGESRPFDPFDRFAQKKGSKGKSLEQLLEEFKNLRLRNLDALEKMTLQPQDFNRRGCHPGLGTVTLGQLLSTWVVHDLGHISQIARVMAKQYKDEVGPWFAYLPVLAK